jgi:hypothetical protein
LLEEAAQKLSQLPKGRQDELAQLLIDVAAGDLSPYQLTTALSGGGRGVGYFALVVTLRRGDRATGCSSI